MIRLSLVLTFAIACVGCGPISRVRIPLVEPEEAIDVPSLHGTFSIANANGHPKFVHVGTAGDRFPAGFLKVVFVDDASLDGLTASTWPAFAYTVKGTHILHLPIPRDLEALDISRDVSFWSKPWAKTEIGGYLLMRVKESDRDLLVSVVDGTFLAKEIEAGNLSGTVTNYRTNADRISVDITSSRVELQSFLETHINDAFESKHTILQRVNLKADR